jgi:hypothetical protein
MPIYPLLMSILSKKIQKEHPNHILISSFAVAKNINQARQKFKIQNPTFKISLYLHSPMQYIRSHHEEYTGKLTGFK